MRVAPVLLVAGALSAGCRNEARGETVTVSAAASLTEAFTEIGRAFGRANPGAAATFNFDSSSTLSSQIIAGAPVDVFASADEASMARLTERNLVAGSPRIFARNELVIVTKPGNPTGITGLAGLGDTGVISLCGKEVPCGRSAEQALDRAGVVVPETSVTRGQNVKATLAAVAAGDAVAGLVYVTDARSSGTSVTSVPIPAEANAIASYPIGVSASASNANAAEAFVSFVLGPQGQALLEEHGFLPPA